MIKLRSYQRSTLDACQSAWQEGDRIVMPVIPTAGGKSVIISQAAIEHDGDGFVMAHRAELVGQLSMALARAGIHHSLTTSTETRRTIQMAHYEEFGSSFIRNNSDWHVGSVDTVIRREIPKLRKALVIQDEGHHTLRENKWGKAFGMFPPDTIGMLPTATPMRADRKGLGSHAAGIVDRMIIGPSGRELIDLGMLTDYEVLTPDLADLDLSGVPVGASGEFNQKKLAEAMKECRQLVGNIVQHYISYAYGKLAVCFAANIAEASRITDAFNGAGIKAELVTGNDAECDRRAKLNRFRARDTLVLVNVDLFGEGFDLPAIEVVIMARPTDSFCLYSQQWGRVLRLMLDGALIQEWDSFTPQARLAFIAASQKPVGLIIDHVGNLIRHEGPPDIPRAWTMDNYEKRGKASTSEYASCPKCIKPYKRMSPVCPHCDHDRHQGLALNKVTGSNIEKVEGDLTYFTREALAEMRKSVINSTSGIFIPQSIKNTPAGANAVKHIKRSRDANDKLRLAMAYWAGMHPSLSQVEKQKLFYLRFGVDALTALTYKYKDSEPLIVKINKELERNGYVIANLHMATDIRVDPTNWMGSDNGTA